MTTIVNDIIDDMRSAAKTLNEMVGVYPGDPDSSMSVQAALLNKAAAWLMRINWETEQQLFYDNISKITITYGNDNDLPDV